MRANGTPSQSQRNLYEFPALTAGLYFTGIMLAEVLTTRFHPAAGLILHGAVLVALIVQGAASRRRVPQRFCFALALVPLIRLMSLALPLTNYPFVYWYLIIGVPLFLAAFFTAQLMGLSIDRMLFRLRPVGLQLGVALTGIGLGYGEYLILRPQPLVESFSFQAIWLPALILLIFTGLLEEVIFRGLLQQAAREYIGRWGLLYAALLFAVMHLGYHSWIDFVFVLAVALWFGMVVLQTGSILGVTLAHGLTNIGLFLVFPFLASTPGLALPAWLPMPPPAGVMMPVTPPTPLAVSLPHTPAATRTPESTLTPRPTSTRTLLPTRTSTLALASPWTPAPSPTLSSFLQRMVDAGVQVPNARIIMVDDGDQGFLRTGGTSWRTTEGIGGDVVWAAPLMGTTDAVVEWQPELPAAGQYEVQVFCPAGFASFRFARYEVGIPEEIKEIVIDQSAHQGEWVSLGVYAFVPGETAFLRLDNQTPYQPGLDELVGFDAVRWIWRGR